MQEQVHPCGMEIDQLRAGDGLCAGNDVWDADGAGTENIAGGKDQPQPSTWWESRP